MRYVESRTYLGNIVDFRGHTSEPSGSIKDQEFFD
jgi:hypothetical protein